MALTKQRNPNFFRTWAVSPWVAINAQFQVYPLQLTTLGRSADQMLPQADWPNPPVSENQDPRYWSSVSYAQLSVTAAAPFSQDEWPVPRGPAYPVTLRTHLDQYHPILVGQDKLPFRQSDWPVPRGWAPRQDWQQAFSLSLNVYPFAQQDWPVPRGPQQGSIVLRSWTWSYNLNLIGQDQLPNNQKDWPNPKGPLPRQDWTSSTSIALKSVTAPFAQGDWPNPRAPAFPVDLRNWVQWYNLNLIGKDQLPALQRDWPNPRGHPPRQDYQQPTRIGLIGQDKLPFALRDWPNPKGQPSRLDWILPTNVALTSVTATPFVQGDWPNPRGAQFSADLRGWIDRTKILLIGQDQLPGRLIVADAPAGAARSVVDWIFPSSVALTTVVVTPFSQTDWPNPRGAQSNDLRGWIDRSKIQLIGQDKLPLRQMDWPVPKGQPPRQDYQKALGLPLNVIPFAQGDWPNPRAPASAIDLRTWINRTNILIGQDQLPVRQPDWPNPRGHQPRQDWQQATRVQLIGQDVLPFRQSDWPVTPAPRAASDLRNWVQQVNLALNVVPFSQTDWPVPKTATPVSTLRTWIDQTKINLIGQDVLPLNQKDWPNPRGPIPGITLRTWLDLVRIQFLGTTPFAELDWPNPRGPAFPVDLRTHTERALRLHGQFNLAGLPNLDWPNPRAPLRNVNVEGFIGLPGLPLQTTTAVVRADHLLTMLGVGL